MYAVEENLGLISKIMGPFFVSLNCIFKLPSRFHFLAINFFCGSWIVKDSQKFFISKSLIFFPLIITYFVGPLGIFIYWIIRIFFAKKISLFD